MTTPRVSPSRRSAFTLVELLTVIGIISLLIGILVPSLARARDIAKKASTRAELDAISKSLSMFENDYQSLPESSSDRIDPITGLPGAGSNNRLMGAHWLARAMAGPDFQGVDIGGHFLKDREKVSVVDGHITSVTSGGSGIPFATAATADRKGSYLESAKVLARDTDNRLQQIRSPGTGRLVIIDSFNWPILYYKANPRARHSFSNTNSRFGPNEPLGIYNLSDNIEITGDGSSGSGWDFAGSGVSHGLGYFGPDQSTILSSPDSVHSDLPPATTHRGKSFVDYLHEHRTHETGNVIKPVKPESFVLISPGKDGIYGTDDDVNNFSD